jgi:transposase
MSRMSSLSDEAWALVEPLMPVASGGGGRPFADHRRLVEGIIWRYRTGTPWRDLPVEFGPWQTVWKRHRRFAADGTWDRVHAALVADADAAGLIDWDVSVDSTINRAHQHATNITRDASGTGGTGELHESARRTR